jgi:hypothetical protein
VSDPHVPGPGWRWPTPQTVATDHAHRGALMGVIGGVSLLVRSSAAIVISGGAVRAGAVGVARPLFSVLGFATGFRIIHRRRDDVMSAGPFAEVDDTAAIAAEREFCVGAEDDLATGGATKGGRRFIFRHNSGRGSTRIRDLILVGKNRFHPRKVKSAWRLNRSRELR